MDLRVPAHELRPEFSLMMGQCFNWRRKINEDVKEGEEEEEEEEGGKEEGLVVEQAAAAAVEGGKGRGGEEEEEEEGGEEEKVWVGVLDRYVLEVQQTRTSTLVRRVVVASGGGVGMEKDEEGEEEVLLARLRDYFQVGVSVVGRREGGTQGCRRSPFLSLVTALTHTPTPPTHCPLYSGVYRRL